MTIKYDPETGVLSRNGKEAGWSQNGYRYLMVDGTRYAAHRYAWYLYYGVWPKMDIDHINQDKSDNRISNLREATESQNLRNQRKIKGYHLHKQSGKWRAMASVDNRVRHIGLFDTEEEARVAYLQYIEPLT